MHIVHPGSPAASEVAADPAGYRDWQWADPAMPLRSLLTPDSREYHG